MEIHIQLAGVKLGPYGEKQVREYLAEGLLSQSDPARYEGTDEWKTVEEILANMPPPAPPTEIAPPQSETFESPLPEAKPAAPVDRPTATSSLLTPTGTIARMPAPTVPPPESTPAPRPSPPVPVSPMVGLTAPLVVKSLARKTAQGAKTSSRLSLSTTSDKPAASGLLPSPIRIIPKKTDADTQAAPEEVSPSVSLPIPKPETRKLPTPSVIRIIPKKADEPAKTPVLPESEPPVASGKLATPTIIPATPAPVQVIAKKPDATLDSPAEATSPAPATTTAMPSTDVAMKAPDSTGTQLPSAVRILAKRMDRSAKAPSGIQGSKITGLPGSSLSDGPGRSSASPTTDTAGGPIRLRGPGIEPKPPGAVETPAVPTPPAPVIPATTAVVPDVAPAHAAAPASAPTSKLALPAEKMVGSRNGLKKALIVASCLILVLVLLAVVYISAPYLAANSLRAALKSGSEGQLGQSIDFPALQQSLKEQMAAQASRSSPPDANGNPTVDPAMNSVLTMINNSIDLYITPASLAALATNSSHFTQDDQSATMAPDVAAGILVRLNTQAPLSQGFVGPDDFMIDLDMVKLHLQFYGLNWKLDRVELKHDLQLMPLPASSTSSDATSPLSSPVVETYINDGKAKFDKHDWDGAIDAFTKVININPKMTAAYFNRGQARQSKGDADGAIADYTQALTLDPTLAVAFFSRANVKSSGTDMDGAIADYTQALTLDPKMTAAYYSRGNARTTKGDYDGAIADYTQVLTLDPNAASAYSNRGLAHQAKGDFDASIADYTQALAIDPKISVAYYNRGLVRQSQGNLDAAILDFNHALDLDPKMAGVYYNRGNAKNTKHDAEGAIADYNQALLLDPKNAYGYCNRGLARQATGDMAGALDDYTQALTLDPKIAVAYYNRGLIKAQQNDPDGAIADSSQALDLDPKEVQAYYNRGFAKLTKGNLSGAGADLRKFCELVPREHYADHARLYLWLIAKALNPKSNPNQELIDSLQNDWNSSLDDPVSKVAGFLLDHFTEADLIAAAASSDVKKDQGQHCEIWYFIGMKRLLAGDRAGAIDFFQKCVATGKKDYCEYILAEAELQSLQPPAKT